jgi:hypothetical protein
MGLGTRPINDILVTILISKNKIVKVLDTIGYRNYILYETLAIV